MFCAVVLLLLNIFDSAVFAQSYKLSNLKLKETSYLSADSQKVLSEKSTLLAGTLSFIVPGFAIGQLYNGQTNKFLTHTIISTVCITTFLITARYAGFPVGGNSEGNRANLGGVLMFLSAITFAGNYVVSVADAVVSAVNINKKVRLQKGRSDIINKLRLGFTVNRNKQLNLKFAFEL